MEKLVDQFIHNVPFNTLWKANWNFLQHIKEATKVFRENPNRINDSSNYWHWILNAGFCISLNKFEAILTLTKPVEGSKFHLEAASLTRNLWELWVTLEWLGIDNETEREKRIELFMEDSHIRQNQLNQTTQERSGLPFSEDENWLKQKANEIKRKRADMKKNNPDELNELPSVFDRLQEIEKRDLRIKGDSKLIYAFIYKDLSEAVHFSIKTIHELRFLLEDSASQESSFFWSNKCLDASGGFFIYITQLWNGTFEVIPEFSFLKWQADWTSSQSRARQVLAGG